MKKGGGGREGMRMMGRVHMHVCTLSSTRESVRMRKYLYVCVCVPFSHVCKVCVCVRISTYALVQDLGHAKGIELLHLSAQPKVDLCLLGLRPIRHAPGNAHKSSPQTVHPNCTPVLSVSIYR